MNIDTAYNDRQELINILIGGLPKPEVQPNESPDTWEAIEAQLNYWADMDREYWRQRKDTEYEAWFDRTYGVKL